ncbi:MAG: hypothetical protein ABSB67_05740 [Bryobacteraceae bacterium]
MNYYEQHRAEYLEELKAFLRIPSISTDPDHKDDIRKAADFALALLKKAGMDNTHLIEGGAAGRPH